MKRTFTKFIFAFSLFLCGQLWSQDISIFEQFNGRYDFTFIGNTMNVQENGANDPCVILTSSSAILNLNTNDEVEKAYLYWAGSGTGDFDVKLNNIDITPDRTFSAVQSTNQNPFFSAFTDITPIVQTLGNALYTLSEFDISSFLNPTTYCINGTNFAGWAIVVVYKNEALPLNQINVYDGLEALSTPVVGTIFSLDIELLNLNVIDNVDAKIGFVAWEGDRFIANQESLSINGNIISDLPLNPPNNAFNGTNSITGSDTLYNMDLDIYNIQNNIQPGDTSALISLTTAQDFVLINCIVTKLNSQIPDATVVIDSIERQCESRDIVVNYTVFNVNSTEILPANTNVALYIDDILVGLSQTINPIPVGENESNSIVISVPNTISDDYIIKIVVDDDGTGQGFVNEINEDNNENFFSTSLLFNPTFNTLEPLTACNEGFKFGTFDLTNYSDEIKTNPDDVVLFYDSQENAINQSNAISILSNYHVQTPKTLYARIFNEDNCYVIMSFELNTINCPPTIYNFVSANNDTLNDFFLIEGLRDIFLNFDIKIYNRWGIIVWQGNQNTEDWRGEVLYGPRFKGNIVPAGTYFYVLNLNDPDYNEPYIGYVYILTAN